MLSEYISQEIDLEILDMLIQDVKSVGYWSTQKVGREWNGSAFQLLIYGENCIQSR